MAKHNFGYYNLDKNFTKDWTATDYLINNQEIKVSKFSTYPLKPQMNGHHIMLKYMLYAIFDLSKTSSKKRFTWEEIRQTITDNKDRYDTLILLRANKVAERGIKDKDIKRKNSNLPNIDYTPELKKRYEYNFLQKKHQAKISVNNYYQIRGWIVGVFIEMSIDNPKPKAYIEDKRIAKIYYWLNAEGKKLMDKVVNENYVL